MTRRLVGGGGGRGGGGEGLGGHDPPKFVLATPWPPNYKRNTFSLKEQIIIYVYFFLIKNIIII